VFQQTPFEITGSEPSSMIIPPEIAEDAVISETNEVVSTGTSSLLHEKTRIVQREMTKKLKLKVMVLIFLTFLMM